MKGDHRRMDECGRVSIARSRLMARVQGKNTKPEMLVRKALRNLGVRYSLHRRSLPGKPDICISSRKLVIFVHGCFWHRHANCSRTSIPKTRRHFWMQKFQANVARDRRNKRDLTRKGWMVRTVWECQCEHPDKLVARLGRIIQQADLNTR